MASMERAAEDGGTREETQRRAAAVAEEGPRDLLEEIEISPLERWRRYGEWPSRQLAHALAVVAAVMHLVMIENVLVTYSESFERNCFNLIFGRSLQHDQFSRHGGFHFDAEDFHANEFVVFNTTDAQVQVVNVVRNYFALQQQAVDFVRVADRGNPHNHVPFPRLHYVMKGRNGTGKWLEIKSENDLGPLAPSASKENVSEFIHAVKSLELFLQLESENPTQYYLMRDACVLWEYRFAYERESGAGPFFATIRQKSEQRCETRVASHEITPIFWLHGWLVFCCFLHAIFAIGRVWRGIRVIQVLRKAVVRKMERSQPSAIRHRPRLHSKTHRLRTTSFIYEVERKESSEEGSLADLDDIGASSTAVLVGDEEDSTSGSDSSIGEPVSWDEIWWRDKLTIINLWNLLSILADACLIVYTVEQMSDLTGGRAHLFSVEESGWMSAVIKMLLGIGCGLHLISLLEYAEYSLVDYLFIQVNRVARMEIFKILVGIIPITIGYIMFGVAMYGDTVSRFGSVRNTAITLFGVCLGDEMWPTFMDLYTGSTQLPSIIHTTYIVSFVVIHLYVVAMSIISVVEEAFITQGLWLLETDTERCEDMFLSESEQAYLDQRIARLLHGNATDDSKEHFSNSPYISLPRQRSEQQAFDDALEHFGEAPIRRQRSLSASSLPCPDTETSSLRSVRPSWNQSATRSGSMVDPLLREERSQREQWRSSAFRRSTPPLSTSTTPSPNSTWTSRSGRPIRQSSGISLHVSRTAARMLQRTAWDGTRRSGTRTQSGIIARPPSSDSTGCPPRRSYSPPPTARQENEETNLAGDSTTHSPSTT